MGMAQINCHRKRRVVQCFNDERWIVVRDSGGPHLRRQPSVPEFGGRDADLQPAAGLDQYAFRRPLVLDTPP